MQVGPRGPMGFKGERGQKGDTGMNGSVGATGSIGSIGNIGVDGPPGPDGNQGPTGATGDVGPVGASVDGAPGLFQELQYAHVYSVYSSATLVPASSPFDFTSTGALTSGMIHAFPNTIIITNPGLYKIFYTVYGKSSVGSLPKFTLYMNGGILTASLSGSGSYSTNNPQTIVGEYIHHKLFPGPDNLQLYNTSTDDFSIEADMNFVGASMIITQLTLS